MRGSDVSVMDGLQKIKELSWQEVFQKWEDIEGKLPHWVEHYQDRGFASWRKWRTSSMAPIKPETLTWNLYQLTDFMHTIPLFRGGPFYSWVRKIYGDKKMPPFAEIIRHPTIRQRVEASRFVQQFPAETTLMGLVVGGDVVIIEGMHRCSAVALAAAEGRSITSTIFIALATYPDNHLPHLGHPDSPT
jgi:hypothetical protein